MAIGSDVTVARGLQIGSDAQGLLYKFFAGSVVEAFHKAIMVWGTDRIQMRNLQPGQKSASFPIFGDSPEEPDYQTVAGSFIDGGTINVTEEIVAVNDPLIKALNVPMVDQQLSAWDQIGPHAMEIGRLIAEDLDKKALVVGVNAARTAAVANVHPGGKQVSRTAASVAAAYPINQTGATNLITDLNTMAQTMDENDIPKGPMIRHAFMSPREYNVLTQDTSVRMSRDYVGGENTQVDVRMINVVEGFSIHTTQLLPSTNITTGPTAYQGNFTVGASLHQPAVLCLANVAGVQGAIGGVQAGGIESIVEADQHRHVWFLKSSVLCGMDVVAPWMAGEIGVKSS